MSSEPQIANLLSLDRRLKLWLPARLRNELDVLALQSSMSRPTFVRHVLVSNVYGAITAHSLRMELDAWSDADIVFSRARTAPGDRAMALGKSDVDSVVLISRRLALDLAWLAMQSQTPVGAYARNVLQAEVFGHAITPLASLREAGLLPGSTEHQPSAAMDVTAGDTAARSSSLWSRLTGNSAVAGQLGLPSVRGTDEALTGLAAAWTCSSSAAGAAAVTIFALGRRSLRAPGRSLSTPHLTSTRGAVIRLALGAEVRDALAVLSELATLSESDLVAAAILRVAKGRVAALGSSPEK